MELNISKDELIDITIALNTMQLYSKDKKREKLIKYLTLKV